MKKIDYCRVNCMFKNINRKGFTVIELLGVIVLLAVIMGIGTYSIVGVLNDYKEKSYDLLIENIKSSVEEYYIECKYQGSSITCPTENSGWYQIKLDDLVKYGFLKGNSEDENGISTLINPKDDKKMDACEIKYSYSDGKIKINPVDTSLDSSKYSCPTSY